MIFYYSATGNSFWMAKKISDVQNDTLISVTDELKNGKPLNYSIKNNETLGFVFPVHAWNPPNTLLHFIKKMNITGYMGQYTYAVATCGNSSGNTMNVLKRTLSKKDITLNSQWEIKMPNNYLPLGDIDSRDKQEAKLKIAKKKIAHINTAIKSCIAEQRLCKGSFSFFKTSVMGSLFHKFAMGTSPFYVTSNCISCGLCEKICLSGVISMKNGKPVWTGKTCDQCGACINRCPKKAIQYGKKTSSRGRYCHPIYKEKN
ncbi:MAG: EFR1 family ferrodoxin [Clostridia bacterium]|jgi:ferredoxin|nr:EFR1 family ferrodoxin [Clostridia bacterium]MCI1998927.1 EFR1 family ferrodoxin [Clostridia bacterium]MCI2013677.1 EFR1 family ferrodoxin [Clostridia bacterium]